MYSGLLADYHAVRDERDAALAEVARLREALEQIGQVRSGMDGADMDRALRDVQRILSAALAEGSDVLPTQRGN